MEEKGDVLSSLPSEILQHIISMLSLKEAVQISTLSTSWRRLMCPSRLNLSSSNQELHHTIQSLSESGAGFRTLILHLDAAALAVCTKGVNGELHLDFSLHILIPTTFSLIVKQATRRPSFSHIKTLHLRSIPRLAGDTLSDLCSRVEDLKMEKCSGLESIEIESSESLKNLEISDCPNIVRIVLVSARKLKSLWYKGVFPLIRLLNVPNLVRVGLDLGDGLGGKELDCEDCVSLLSSLKDIESLQLSSCLVEALCCCGVIFRQLDFRFSRLKDLKMICSKVSSKTRDSFACFLHITPSLEELELRVRIEQGWGGGVEYPTHCQNWHDAHLWKDYATVKEEACRLKHMKRVRIMGFTMERDELLWMDLLLHNGINLKEMIVDDCWRVAKVPFTQLNYIKLQYLLIPCPDIHSYFVLIADSTPKL
ncbi:F-box protein At5g03100-like [Salvia miltiorrhiza]|uniref:F-box protein At5g03100-like n=1 Tax=Salvia miltiorrhiza TaxID=226208 RepID=UPI0025ACF913|nr:F-box protein At5g03100-like [Salvia miltiorrhiza]